MLASTVTTVKARSVSQSACPPISPSSGLLLAAVLIAAFLPAVPAAWRPEPPRSFEVAPLAAPPAGPAFYAERFIDPTLSWPTLHTPTLGELSDGRLLAVWKTGGAGERGTGDVTLRAATFVPGAERWSPPRLVTSGRRTQRELGRVVRTLANPVLLPEPGGRMRLLYVTAWRKWSTSALAVKTSTDGGVTWSRAERMVTSPVANVATLVKTAPVRFADGSVAVPAYHELWGLFPQVFRLSAEGEVLDKVRIPGGKKALQPSIVPLDGQHAIALMRNGAKGHILAARTRDAGQHWDPVVPIDLPNPNAPVMGLRLADGALLLVFNNHASSRDVLSLALSRDGGARWQVFHAFEEGERTWDGALANFSYPYLLRAADGVIHVIYVWRLRQIKHVAFNEAWIRERAR